MKIGASFLGSKDIVDTLEKLNVTDVDFIHVDVMDGKYVKNRSMPIRDLKIISYYTRKRLDVHLMVIKPLKYLKTLVNLNVQYINIHLNIKDDIEKVIKKTHEFGIKIGLVVNPNQDVELVYSYLDKIDLVLIMSVVPGKSGQDFIPDTPLKIKKLRSEIKRRKLKVLISVDGGINYLNAKDLHDADIIVSGSTIINSDNYQDTINKLRKCAAK